MAFCCGLCSKLIKIFGTNTYSAAVNVTDTVKARFPPVLGISFFVGLGLCLIIYVTHKFHFARIYRNRFGIGYSSVHTIPVAHVKPTVIVQ
ncbi:hypothetical protein evm_010565 [Chilo suppressalis]|nr:hypothetical protein evm_010565 [Chilo suppressalis]